MLFYSITYILVGEEEQQKDFRNPTRNYFRCIFLKLREQSPLKLLIYYVRQQSFLGLNSCNFLHCQLLYNSLMEAMDSLFLKNTMKIKAFFKLPHSSPLPNIYWFGDKGQLDSSSYSSQQTGTLLVAKHLNGSEGFFK